MSDKCRCWNVARDGHQLDCPEGRPRPSRSMIRPNPTPWWEGRRDRDQLTGAYIPGTERQDPLTGEWHA